ncbi:exodeoxyribonuclease VII small subunit [Methylobacterium sp. C25]|uniref:Exodeoxyribonuclease 7 small subunit n=1 Tax=Methylobacterium brachythecii TaxID=1176177 RepID=A0A7W6F7K3_9HYPH|nr:MULTISPECIES: exodeoxyribonuclease VII small subunit [Methylobacterium]MBB3903470.1 exodeoxyribonuclease VII small subunit [Methylobacterium brachythecii]MCE4225798.1 exodeoxyribonuclease VII small subunit [Methylobacterium sp. C25]GLS44177.1 exodeoxyribonuclease 7 small subunit [Methylobacterium brachythecii]
MNAARSAAPGSVPVAPEAVAEDLPFEAALAQLEDIVRQLEKGDVPLDKSVEIYERGEALKRHCESLLKKAETRIQRITLGSDGQAASVAPLDVE